MTKKQIESYNPFPSPSPQCRSDAVSSQPQTNQQVATTPCLYFQAKKRGAVGGKLTDEALQMELSKFGEIVDYRRSHPTAGYVMYASVESAQAALSGPPVIVKDFSLMLMPRQKIPE